MFIYFCTGRFIVYKLFVICLLIILPHRMQFKDDDDNGLSLQGLELLQ